MPACPTDLKSVDARESSDVRNLVERALNTGVSVIIATLNPGASLARCLESVLEQKGVDLEVIVVDGSSTDGTVDFLARVESQLQYWRSAPDHGIYDAWNHGLDHCTKEWVTFLGADDVLVSSRALLNLTSLAKENNSLLVTSRNSLVDANGKVLGRVGQAWNWSQHIFWQKISHSGTLHHKSLFERFGKFDSSLKIVGDYEFLLRLGREVPSSFYPHPTVLVGAYGVSRNILRCYEETRLVQSRHPLFGPVKASILFYYKSLKYIAKPLASVLGRRRF